MTAYQVLTTASETRDEIKAHYYLVDDEVLLTFKDEQHKQIASYNLRSVISVIKQDDPKGPFAPSDPERSGAVKALRNMAARFSWAKGDPEYDRIIMALEVQADEIEAGDEL